ncbi:hypothetical protein Adt_11341 [Abeliophyllum distichum]|uniref:Uncharacterized protein n=1 Tax=Abeliophyllum distichum TaxID=126358 RepID=A0ABD1UMK2_9LAMI
MTSMMGFFPFPHPSSDPQNIFTEGGIYLDPNHLKTPVLQPLSSLSSSIPSRNHALEIAFSVKIGVDHHNLHLNQYPSNKNPHNLQHLTNWDQWERTLSQNQI